MSIAASDKNMAVAFRTNDVFSSCQDDDETLQFPHGLQFVNISQEDQVPAKSQRTTMKTDGRYADDKIHESAKNLKGIKM